MNTLITEVQKALIAEFEKRGVVIHLQIEETHPEIAKIYDTLCFFPEKLKTSDVFKIMNWLELEELKVDKLTFKKS